MEIRNKIKVAARRKSGNLQGKYLIAKHRKGAGDELTVKMGTDEALRQVLRRFGH